jgi:uncharacterized membrane protein
MTPMGGHLRGLFLVHMLFVIVVVVTAVVALWKAMRAQERIAKTLEGIERALGQRPPS